MVSGAPYPVALATALALLVAAAGPGCGGTSEYVVVGTQRAPGADGTIQVEDIEGGTALVTISVEHLVAPARLGDGLGAYVVWFEGDDGAAVKAGTLEYDPDARSGRMMATTPLSEFVVKITAESEPTARTPGEVVVAENRVSAE